MSQRTLAASAPADRARSAKRQAIPAHPAVNNHVDRTDDGGLMALRLLNVRDRARRSDFKRVFQLLCGG